MELWISFNNVSWNLSEPDQRPEDQVAEAVAEDQATFSSLLHAVDEPAGKCFENYNKL